MVKKLTMNETRKGVLNVLKGADAPMTLADMSKVLGKDVKSGSMNTLVSAGVVRVAGVVKVPVVTFREVNTYVLGDTSVLDQDEADK